MAIGRSHRIVIEVEPEVKKRIYAALKQRRLTLKEWFLNSVQEDLLSKIEILEKEKKRDQ